MIISAKRKNKNNPRFSGLNVKVKQMHKTAESTTDFFSEESKKSTQRCCKRILENWH